MMIIDIINTDVALSVLCCGSRFIMKISYNLYSLFGVLQRSVVQQVRLPILAPGHRVDIRLVNAVASLSLHLT